MREARGRPAATGRDARTSTRRDGDARNLEWAPDARRRRPRPASGPLQGRWGWLSRLAEEAYGLPRHLSQHPGGMIVSTRPLVDCVPLVPAAMEGRQMCHWDKDSCADAGFLKIDLLGLGMLSAVERCVEEIARTRRERIDLSRIPYDDKPTYEAIQKADTMGVFQIESRAQMQSLLRTRPETLDDLTIQVAIVRPGPIVGGAVNPYIDRKQKLRANPDFKIPYDHPSLEPVLKDTLGTIIFQDQVLEVAMAFAGFSPGEAEGLRRAMSRKRSAAAIEAYHERFVAGRGPHPRRRPGDGRARLHDDRRLLGLRLPQGARRRLRPARLPVDLAARALQAGVHVRAAQRAADGLLPLGHADPRVPAHGHRGPPARRQRTRGCCATWRPSGSARVIRIGLGYLNGARADEVAAIVAEREARGPYGSLGELASRAGAGRPALSVLAWSGACDSLHRRAAPSSGRRQALWQLGRRGAGARGRRRATQLALPLELPEAPDLKPLEAWERMVADYATTGVTAGAHPMALVREDLPADVVHAGDLERLRHGTRVRIGGLVVARQRPATANGIVFMLLEDEHGTINLVVPPATYDRDRLVVRGEPLVFAEGRLEKHPKAAGAINIVVDSLRPLDTSRIGPAADVIPLLVVRRAAARTRWPTPSRSSRGRRAAAAAGGRRARDFAAVAPPVQSFAQGRRR